jgi:uncharacterized phage protein gp47/JayE
VYGSIELRSSPEVEARIRNAVVANTDLTDFLPADPMNRLIGANADEFEVCYVQIGKVLTLFDVRKCTDDDLDLRMVDYDEEREGKQFATGAVQFSRSTASATALAILAGTEVATPNGNTYTTVTDTEIPSSGTTSAVVAIVAKVAGSASNARTGAVSLVLTAFQGAAADGLVCTNPAPIQNGLDQESDESAKTRIFAKTRALNRTAPDALKAAARGVKLVSGVRVRNVELYEDLFVAGRFDLFVDNGTGYTATTASIGTGVAADGAGELLCASATAGQFRFQVQNWPIKIDHGGTDLPNLLLFRKPLAGAWTLITYPDFAVKAGTGQIVLAVPLAAGEALQAHYTYNTGLLAAVQWTLDGKSSDPTTYPGGVAAGANLRVRAPTLYKPSIACKVTVRQGYDGPTVRATVVDELLVYINSREIGESVLLSMLYDVAMDVDGVTDFLVTDPAPADPASNIVVAYDAICRMTTADISAT